MQFIADIRNSKNEEDEGKRIQAEIVNIQRNFSSSPSGYQKKKYICKLLYIYLLGHDLDFGYDEMVSLMRSKTFSEKQIGYLAASLLLHDSVKLKEEVISCINSDLTVNDEHVNCLALHCIANSADSTWSDLFADNVFQILRSPTNSPNLRKKASLALLKLFKQDLSLLHSKRNWIPRILSVLDEKDLGLCMSVVSLVLFLANESPEESRTCLPMAVKKLRYLLVDDMCPEEYLYYGVPSPWLIVKLFRLVEVLTPNAEILDPTLLDTLRKCISKAIQKTTKMSSTETSQQSKNARSAILFDAVSLASHLDPSPSAIAGALEALGALLNSPETNTRYLALDGLTKVSARCNSVTANPIKKHLNKMFNVLKDKDVSVKRRALDLLYTICDLSNVEQICAELLVMLPHVDLSLRGEMTIKIAAMAEQFASDASWYVTTCLQLLSIGGTHIGEEVWQRVAQIVVNNEPLRSIAVKTVVRYMKIGSITENLLMCATFFLCQYGYLVEQSISTREQFDLLHEKYFHCSLTTRTMMLSGFLSIFQRCKELQPVILDLYELESYSIDSEIQERATQYMKIVTREDGGKLLDLVTGLMPPFVSNKPSPLMSRLGQVASTDKPIRLKSLQRKNASHPPPPPPPSRHAVSRSRNNSTLNSSGKVVLSPNWEEGYYRLIQFDQGIFYESSLVKVVLRCSKQEEVLGYQLSLINKSPAEISGLSCEVVSNTTSTNPAYQTRVVTFPHSGIALNSKCSFAFDITVRSLFPDQETPYLTVSFMTGNSFNNLTLNLPVVCLKMLSPTVIPNAEEFFRRWNQIEALGEEWQYQRTFSSGFRQSHHSLCRLFERLGFHVMEGVDADQNVLGVGIVRTLSGKSGALARLEPGNDNKDFRLTLRSTQSGAAHILGSTICALFQKGI